MKRTHGWILLLAFSLTLIKKTSATPIPMEQDPYHNLYQYYEPGSHPVQQSWNADQSASGFDGMSSWTQNHPGSINQGHVPWNMQTHAPYANIHGHGSALNHPMLQSDYLGNAYHGNDALHGDYHPINHGKEIDLDLHLGLGSGTSQSQEDSSQALNQDNIPVGHREKLKGYAWQKNLSEEDVLKVIKVVAKQWPPAGKKTNRSNLDRLNAYLDGYPLQIPKILNSNEEAIKHATIFSRPEISKPRSKTEKVESVKELIAWLRSPDRRWVLDPDGQPTWAPPEMKYDEMVAFIKALHVAWMTDKPTVKKTLSKLSPDLVAQWWRDIISSDTPKAHQAAQLFKGIIQSQSPQERKLRERQSDNVDSVFNQLNPEQPEILGHYDTLHGHQLQRQQPGTSSSNEQMSYHTYQDPYHQYWHQGQNEYPSYDQQPGWGPSK